MLISLHIPKAAGSSFALSLKDHYGQQFLPDYSDIPLNTKPLKRNRHALIQSAVNRFKNYNRNQCIHGHFLPLKYKFISSSKNPSTFITWFREPSERLASQYYYMKRHYTPLKAKGRPMLKRMIDENWSLEQFCFSNEFRNCYTQLLWGFNIRNFDFIGIVEHYESDLEYFSHNFISNKLTSYRENTNTDQQNESYFLDKNLKKAIQKFHQADLDLYHKALLRRSNERQ